MYQKGLLVERGTIDRVESPPPPFENLPLKIFPKFAAHPLDEPESYRFSLLGRLSRLQAYRIPGNPRTTVLQGKEG